MSNSAPCLRSPQREAGGPKRRGWFASSCLSEKELKAQLLRQDDHPLIPQTLWPGELWTAVVEKWQVRATAQE